MPSSYSDREEWGDSGSFRQDREVVGLRADGAASLLGKSARERTAPNKFKRGVILVGARYEGCSVIDSDCSSLGWTSECAKLERES